MLGEVVLGGVVLGEVVLGEVALGEVALGEVVLGEVVPDEVVLGGVGVFSLEELLSQAASPRRATPVTRPARIFVIACLL